MRPLPSVGVLLWLLVFVLAYWLAGRTGVLALAIIVLFVPVVWACVPLVRGG
jgi:hypothetical protein